MTKATAKEKTRRTTTVPVTTMEEIPLLDERERAELIRALQEAEARAAAGEAVDYDPKKFKQRLIDIYRAPKR
jgi:glutathionyl-hydroquinone reductase